MTFDPSQDYSTPSSGVKLVTAVTNDQPFLDSFYLPSEFTYQPFEPQELFLESRQQPNDINSAWKLGDIPISGEVVPSYILEVRDPLSNPSFGGLIVDNSSTFTYTFDGTAEVSSNLSAVPEPSSLCLLGTGLLGALGAAKRRFA